MEYTANTMNDVSYHLEDFHHADINISDVVNQQNAVLYL